MGYGSSSKGGGGSGNSGGGKKKSGRQKQPKSREFKVKQQKSTVTPHPPPRLPAFTVIEPDPEKRTRLLNARKREKQDANARKVALRASVKNTHGRMLGNGAEVEVEVDVDVDVDTAGRDKGITKKTAGIQSQRQNPTTDREKRLAFLTIQKAKAEGTRRELIKAKRIRQNAPFVDQMRVTQQNLEVLATRLSSEKEFEDVRCLLGVVLKNASTKSNPKYKVLKACSNDNLWRRLLQHPEIVTILGAAGFQRENNIGKIRAVEVAKEEATRVRMERNRINLLIAKTLDGSCSLPSSSSDQSKPQDATVSSLVTDLEALEVEEQAPVMLSCAVADNDEAQDRDFELCHPGTNQINQIMIEQIFAILRVVNGNNCGG